MKEIFFSKDFDFFDVDYECLEDDKKIKFCLFKKKVINVLNKFKYFFIKKI